MRFNCTEHGNIDEVTADGYSLGHRTPNMNELDLEGITFTISSPEGDELTTNHISSEAGEYLQKFSNPYKQIVTAFEEYDAISLGLQCPDCDYPETVRIVE